MLRKEKYINNTVKYNITTNNTYIENNDHYVNLYTYNFFVCLFECNMKINFQQILYFFGMCMSI